MHAVSTKLLSNLESKRVTRWLSVRYVHLWLKQEKRSGTESEIARMELSDFNKVRSQQMEMLWNEEPKRVASKTVNSKDDDAVRWPKFS